MQESLPITVIVAAKNEEINLGRCLEALHRVARVVIVDSASTDRTVEIGRQYGAEIIQFVRTTPYPKKRQWALENVDILTEWVLLLDADEVVPAGLWDEIGRAISLPKAADAYVITKGFHFLGRRFRFGGFSHGAVLLFRRGSAHFEKLTHDDACGFDMEVHERLIVSGRLGRLRTHLIHEDFKGLQAYVERHNQYSTWEAAVRREFLRNGRWGEDCVRPRLFGNVQERRRFIKRIAIRVPGESLLWFFYHYFIRLGFLEGRAGMIASRIRSDYIAMVRAKMYEFPDMNKSHGKP